MGSLFGGGQEEPEKPKPPASAAAAARASNPLLRGLEEIGVVAPVDPASDGGKNGRVRLRGGPNARRNEVPGLSL